MAADGDPSAATELCTSCGLCCSGILFDSAPLEGNELGFAAELGLDPYFDPPGQARFDFPCPHLRETRCGVYPNRPHVCGAFECEVLKKLTRDELTQAEAAALVTEAKQRIDTVRPLAVECGGSITPKRWGSLLESWSARAKARTATPKQAILVLELAKLNRFLDNHFRSRDQQVVRAKNSLKSLEFQSEARSQRR